MQVSKQWKTETIFKILKSSLGMWIILCYFLSFHITIYKKFYIASIVVIVV